MSVCMYGCVYGVFGCIYVYVCMCVGLHARMYICIGLQASKFDPLMIWFITGYAMSGKEWVCVIANFNLLHYIWLYVFVIVGCWLIEDAVGANIVHNVGCQFAIEVKETLQTLRQQQSLHSRGHIGKTRANGSLGMDIGMEEWLESRY